MSEIVLGPDASSRIDELAMALRGSAANWEDERVFEFQSHLAELAREQARTAGRSVATAADVERAYDQFGGHEAAKVAFLRTQTGTARPPLPRGVWYWHAVAFLLAAMFLFPTPSKWSLFIVGAVAASFAASAFRRPSMGATIGGFLAAWTIGPALVSLYVTTPNAELIFLFTYGLIGLCLLAAAWDAGAMRVRKKSKPSA